MRILANRSTTNGSHINGECVMIDRYGDVYNCIDNKYHPNPGTGEDEYSEIERTVDWLLANNLSAIQEECKNWIFARTAQEIIDQPDASFEDILFDVMFCDTYQPCELTMKLVRMAYNYFRQSLDFDTTPDERLQYWARTNPLVFAERITNYLNETFLRVRAGGKLNPQGANAIYFRISSHGYDWRSVIEDFLWDTFGSPKSMPNRIWIGHDAETNPPETVLFDGSPEEFLEYDHKIVANELS